MNKSGRFLSAVMAMSVGSIAGWAGTVTYVGIPSIESDGNCGIGQTHRYTTAIDGGNTRGSNRILNGITFFPLSGRGRNIVTADNCTLSALSGTLTDAGLTSQSIAADGVCRNLLSDMVFNNAGGDNSEVEIVLNPASLELGATYDLRIYICSSSSQNRQVNLAFFGDGQSGVETGFFNEDDARTSTGGFPAPNQAYYINYRYTWSGDFTAGISVIQKFGGAPFCLYALTNELVEPAPLAGAAMDGAEQGNVSGPDQSHDSATAGRPVGAGADRAHLRSDKTHHAGPSPMVGDSSIRADQHRGKNRSFADETNTPSQPQSAAAARTEPRYHPGQALTKPANGPAITQSGVAPDWGGNQQLDSGAEANGTSADGQMRNQSGAELSNRRHRRHRPSGVRSGLSAARPTPSPTPGRLWRIQP